MDFRLSSAPTPIKNWHARGEFQDLLGHSIFVIDEGSDELPVIMLLHGFPTSSWETMK